MALQVHRLANALCDRGHVVTCFSFSPRPADGRYLHVELTSCCTRVVAKFLPAFAFKKIDKHGYDILHYHGDDYLTPGSHNRIRTFYGSAWFEFLHARSLSRRLYQLLFYLFERISSLRQGTLVAISASTRTALPRISAIIPCGIDTTIFKPGTKSSHPSILMVGYGGERKGGRNLITQFTDVVLPTHPETILFVVGPQKVTGANIVWLGTIDESEIIRYYQQSWIYCMSSTYEGFGVPILEAWGSGTAVVSIHNAGADELITHEQNGFLCTAYDLGLTLNTLLVSHSGRRNLAQNGLQSVASYDITSIAARYENLYQTIMANPPSFAGG